MHKRYVLEGLERIGDSTSPILSEIKDLHQVMNRLSCLGRKESNMERRSGPYGSRDIGGALQQPKGWS